jgi:hypothetical protein
VLHGAAGLLRRVDPHGRRRGGAVVAGRSGAGASSALHAVAPAAKTASNATRAIARIGQTIPEAIADEPGHLGRRPRRGHRPRRRRGDVELGRQGESPVHRRPGRLGARQGRHRAVVETAGNRTVRRPESAHRVRSPATTPASRSSPRHRRLVDRLPPPGEAIVVSTAPTYKQVHAILWEEIRARHKRRPPRPGAAVRRVEARRRHPRRDRPQAGRHRRARLPGHPPPLRAGHPRRGVRHPRPAVDRGRGDHHERRLPHPRDRQPRRPEHRVRRRSASPAPGGTSSGSPRSTPRTSPTRRCPSRCGRCSWTRSGSRTRSAGGARTRPGTCRRSSASSPSSARTR